MERKFAFFSEYEGDVELNENVRELSTELREKFGKDSYIILKNATINGFLNPDFIKELSEAFEENKLDEKIKEPKKRKR